MLRLGLRSGPRPHHRLKGRGLPSSELRAWSASQGHLDPARQLLHDGHRGVATIESDRDSRLRSRDGVGVSGTVLGKHDYGLVTAFSASTMPHSRHESVRRDIEAVLQDQSHDHRDLPPLPPHNPPKPSARTCACWQRSGPRGHGWTKPHCQQVPNAVDHPTVSACAVRHMRGSQSNRFQLRAKPPRLHCHKLVPWESRR